MKEVLVSIVCDVYNHEPYLRQCLDGFVMQKTDFEFEILIHDDASTDGSVGIIREYIDKYSDLNWNPIFQKENQYSQGIGIWHDIQFPRAKGKYVAICEGDDYWTDPYKLQKQVNFMEEHSDYSLCTTSTQCIKEDGTSNSKYGCHHKIDSDVTTEEIIMGGGLYLNTVSTLYKKEVLFQCNYHWRKNADVGDFPLCIAASLLGKVRFLADTTAVYRYQTVGSWSYQNKELSREIAHAKREIKWMEEFDIFFKHKYSTSVYKHLFEYYRFLYHQHEVTTKKYLELIVHLPIYLRKKIIKDVMCCILRK